MMKFVSQVEADLVAAAQRTYPTAPARWTRWRSHPTRLAALLVTLVIAGPALAVTQPWRPVLGDPASSGRKATVATDSPPREQLNRLAVLRRSPVPADRGPHVREMLKYVGASLEGVRTDYIRGLGAAVSDQAAVLVPAQTYKMVDEPLPGQPDLRKRDALCVIMPDHDGAGRACWTLPEVLSGQAVASLGRTVYGLAPDGVSKVTMTLRGGTASAAVHDNFFAATAPSNPDDPSGVPGRTTAVQWYDADGQPVSP